MSEGPAERHDEDPIDRRVFYGLLAIGAGFAAFGVRALHERDVPLDGFATWFVGALVLHDLVLAPVVVLAGRALGRLVPAPWRQVAQAAALVAGAVLLFSVPALFGDGEDPRDPSQLPNDAGRSVLLVLGAVAVSAGVLALVARFRRRRAA